uniref:Pleckstrin homology domain-containing family F member 2 n=2 Tax=Parascaris univalens TaxID=6257 RepID=A0A915A526_PARUN
MVDRLVNSEVNARRVANVEACFGSSGQPLAAYGRVLVGEGVLVKMCRKKPKPRQFFLFNDILIYGNILISKRRYNKQHVIPLEEVQLQDLEDDGEMRNGWLVKTRAKSFAVYAATSTEKKEWMLHIERCVHDILTKGGKKAATEHAAVWIPDGEAPKCMACQKTQFTVLQRRHHCRACGNVVCASCSTHNYRIAGLGKRPVRVCDKCFTSFTLSGREDAKNLPTEANILGNESSDSDDDEKNANYDHQPTFYSGGSSSLTDSERLAGPSMVPVANTNRLWEAHS